MYKITKELPFNEQIEIVPFGDIHYGNPNCKIKKFKEVIDYIAKTENCYGIGMGDYLDCITNQDNRFDPSNGYDFIDDNVAYMVNLLKPIKHKLIALVTGNHEYKINTLGIGDPTLRMCRELEIPYLGYSGFVKLKVDAKYHIRSLIILAHHGWSAGRKTGNIINSVESLSQYWDADIYLCGHSHHLSATRQIKIGWTGEKKLIFANTGTFLETATKNTTCYSERGGYPPRKLGVLKLKWFPKRDDIHVSE